MTKLHGAFFAIALSSISTAGKAQDWQSVIADNGRSTVCIQARFEGVMRPVVGTGFIIAPNLDIVTNRHLIESDRGVLTDLKGTIGSCNGAPIQLLIKERDPIQDVAVLRFSPIPEGLRAVELGMSGGIAEGSPVMTLGYPVNVTPPPTPIPKTGIVTNMSGFLSDFTIAVETDMILAPGNSGGPVFNGSGEAVAIVASRLNWLADGSPVVDISYAIPIDGIGLTSVAAALQVASAPTLVEGPFVTKYETVERTMPADSAAMAEVACDEGFSVVAGGFDLNSSQVRAVSSRPLESNRWRVELYNPSTTQERYSVLVFATCASENLVTEAPR